MVQHCSALGIGCFGSNPFMPWVVYSDGVCWSTRPDAPPILSLNNCFAKLPRPEFIEGLVNSAALGKVVYGGFDLADPPLNTVATCGCGLELRSFFILNNAAPSGAV